MNLIVKKQSKILAIIIIFFILSIFINNIYATDSIIEGADRFIELGVSSPLRQQNIKQASDLIYNVLFAAGTVIVIIVGAILGLQFIMGSVEEKAKVKESIIPFVVGSVVIFGSFAIWKVVAMALSGI